MAEEVPESVRLTLPRSPALLRLLVLTIVLFAAAFAASCWYCKGTVWLYNNETWPILSCPRMYLNSGDSWGSQGFCSADILDTIELDLALSGYDCLVYQVEVNSVLQRYRTCSLDYACDTFCSYNDGPCPDASNIAAPTAYGSDTPMCSLNDALGGSLIIVPCRELEITPYCDGTFTVTPGDIVGIRGLVSACLVIVLLWIFAELTLRSTDYALKSEWLAGKARTAPIIVSIESDQRKRLEDIWTDLYQSNQSKQRSRGLYVPGVSSSRRTALYSRNPKLRFDSQAWHRRIHRWQDSRSTEKNRFKPRLFVRSCVLSVFFLALVVCGMYCIIELSPPAISPDTEVGPTLFDLLSIWQAVSWLDILMFIEVFLDIFIFSVACCVVHWPRSPLVAKVLYQNRVKEEKEGFPDVDSSESGVSTDKSFELDLYSANDICVMIACHESTLTEDGETAFRNTLVCALKVFPPSYIFVCDNGNSINPTDATLAVVRSVHPDINYLYVPEGNKTFAFYWCNRYWVTFLNQCGRVPDFKYALMIDDDVTLPPDLHIPREYLRLHPEVKAVHFPITATVPPGECPSLLVAFQDLEYKMVAVHKYFQSTLSRCLSCHGAVGLWERDTLNRVFYDHDTVFHGDDLVMGIALLRLRDDARIISCPQSIVPTYAPQSWGMLFRQRVKSWELTSHKKTFTYVSELLNPLTYIHAPSLLLKPYFIQEVLSIALDWVRIFLLAGLLLRDWLSLILLTSVFTAFLYMQVLMLQFIYLRKRPDLRCSPVSAVMFPFYRLACLIFRLCALIYNVLVYSKDRKTPTIGYREKYIRDIPPCPPHPDVDWFSCWTGHFPPDELDAAV